VQAVLLPEDAALHHPSQDAGGLVAQLLTKVLFLLVLGEADGEGDEALGIAYFFF
jgi:hypothetical protein